MSRVLGFTFFLLLLAAIALISLKDMRPIAESSSLVEFTGIEWRPVSIGDELIATDSRLTLRFESGGDLNGHGGCNDFFASYTINEAGMDIGPIGGTRMACTDVQMRIEILFMDVLDKAGGIEVRGRRLILSDRSGQVLAIFEQNVRSIAE